MVEKIISESKSFKGWSFKEWFKGNWNTIKQILKVGLPWVGSTFLTGNIAAQGFIAICGKFVIDSGEYWYKTYTK